MKINRLFGIYGRNQRRQGGEKGQVLLLVLVLLLVGILFITSTMGFMSTSFKTNRVYINNTVSLYASEAGIQDGIWNILNQSASDLATNLLTPISPNTNSFTQYDYNTNGWMYHLYDPTAGNTTPINVNTYPVNITLKNTWVPLVDDSTPGWVPTLLNPLPPDGVISPPSTATASNIENNTAGTINTILSVTGGVSTIPTYKINILFTGTNNATNSIPVVSVGCWLPQGFTYNNASSNLYLNGDTTKPLFTTEQVLQCSGNEAVVWTFTAQTFYSLQQSMGQTGNNLSIQFSYTTALAKVPECLPWFVDGTSSNTDFPYPYTWDFDTTLYDMTATAGNTAIEAFVPKSETRTLGNAVSGDYVAVGNSLLTVDTTNPYNLAHDVRTVVVSHSSAVASGIPSDSNVQGAYLYWTGWIDGTTSSKPLGASYGTLVNFKVHGVQLYYNTHGLPVVGSSPLACSSYQTNNVSVGGYAYSCYRDVTALVRYELQALNPSAGNLPGNDTYDVGAASGCTLASTTDNTGGIEAANCGWSLVIIYSGPSTLGHQLYLYDNFATAAGNTGHSYNGSDIDVTGDTNGPGGVISGFLVPPQVQYSDGTWEPVAAKITAFVGEGDYCYSGDFIALNAPLTYQGTTTGHTPWDIPDGNPSKLWDGVTLAAPNLGQSGDPNLPNSAAQPDNVWNGKSQSGATLDGVDIKTFNILWSSGLIHAGDVSARIDIPTQVDGFNIVYMIFSFRSSVTSGGAISYLIKRKNGS
jgi:hypothetical protein